MPTSVHSRLDTLPFKNWEFFKNNSTFSLHCFPTIATSIAPKSHQKSAKPLCQFACFRTEFIQPKTFQKCSKFTSYQQW